MTVPRVLLINVGHLTRGMDNVTPPVGLLYLAAQARQALGAEVRIVDQRGHDFPEAEVVRQAVEFNPDVIGMRCLTPDSSYMKVLADAFRASLPKALLVAGGPHASSNPAAVIRLLQLDAVVSGEGELSFEMILRAWQEGGGFGHIPGLHWRDKSGELVENAGFPPIVEGLDALPMPAYDLLDPKLYWNSKNMSILARRKYLSLFTSRGCPYQCNYCHSIFGKRFRGHSPERIVEEIKQLNRRYGVLDFDILDDCFNFDRQRVLAFSEQVRGTGLRTKFAFPNAIRTDILTQEVVDALADAGTYVSSFALESGSPRIQKMIGKHLNIDRFLTGVEMAAKRGIFGMGFAMLGFPGESLEEMRMTIDTACRSMLHVMLFFTVTPYQGTELYRQVQKTDPAKLESVDYENSDYMVKLAANLSPFGDKEILAILREANLRFYLNPRRAFRVLRDHPAKSELWRHPPKKLLHLVTKRDMRGW